MKKLHVCFAEVAARCVILRRKCCKILGQELQRQLLTAVAGSGGAGCSEARGHLHRRHIKSYAIHDVGQEAGVRCEGALTSCRALAAAAVCKGALANSRYCRNNIERVVGGVYVYSAAPGDALQYVTANTVNMTTKPARAAGSCSPLHGTELDAAFRCQPDNVRPIDSDLGEISEEQQHINADAFDIHTAYLNKAIVNRCAYVFAHAVKHRRLLLEQQQSQRGGGISPTRHRLQCSSPPATSDYTLRFSTRAACFLEAVLTRGSGRSGVCERVGTAHGGNNLYPALRVLQRAFTGEPFPAHVSNADV